MKVSSKKLVSMVSSIFRPLNKYENISCHSQTLMLNEGLIYPSTPGTFSLLPLAVTSLEKLIKLVDFHMKSINGQKVIMPALASKTLWSKSGRWEKFGDELFRLNDRSCQELCLGPTHEEIVTDLLASIPKYSYKQLPLKIYQITTKFRDELRPKHGLLRGREFLMKDMYAFDSDQAGAEETYNQVCIAYGKLFTDLGVNFCKVKGSSGTMGGSYSQEFHILSETGEDVLRLCNGCNYGENSEIDNPDEVCPSCGGTLNTKKGIEVGHAFILGDSYSKALSAKFQTKTGKFECYQMSCYGLGITRILAAIIEVLSSKTDMQWPVNISPFLVGVIPPKKGSKEESASNLALHLANTLALNPVLTENVLFDDRTEFTIGKRVKELKAVGIPYLVISGKKSCEDIPKFEIIDVYKDETTFLTHAETMNHFRNKLNEE